MIFPEGTCTNRSGLILFKAGKCSALCRPLSSSLMQPAATWVVSFAAFCLDSCMVTHTWRWTSVRFHAGWSARSLFSVLLRGRRQKLDHFCPPVVACVCVCVCWTIVPGPLCLIPFLPVSNSVIPSKPCWSHSVVLCLSASVFLCVFPGRCVTSPFCMCLLLLCLFTDSHSNSAVFAHVCVCLCVCLMCPAVCYWH